MSGGVAYGDNSSLCTNVDVGVRDVSFVTVLGHIYTVFITLCVFINIIHGVFKNSLPMVKFYLGYLKL